MQRRQPLVLLGIFLFTLIIPALSYSSVEESSFKNLPFYEGHPYVPGEVLIKTRATRFGALSLSEFNTLLSRVGLRDVSHLQRITSEGLYLVKLTNQNVKRALQALEGDPRIDYAEPNYLYRILPKALDPTNPVPDPNPVPAPAPAPVNDPHFGKLWALHNTGQKDGNDRDGMAGSDIDALSAWQITKGSRNIVVAIIDTGIDLTHEDLKENAWVNTKEIPQNQIDDDNNGFVDDVSGWNFYAGSNNAFDDNGHGTHVAGTIGAIANNEKGIVGINWFVTLMPVKFLGEGGSGSTEGAIKAIDYAVKMGARVLNNSWGGGGFSQALGESITRAEEKGVIFVAAAGNDGSDNDRSPHYPSSYSNRNVVAVAATNNRDEAASWSNYGKKSVHVAAPGVSIYSTFPKNEYGYLSGTSMATPHVAGVVALLFSANPSFTIDEIRQRILWGSEEVLPLRRRIEISGRLNAFNAITAVEPPRTPTVDPAKWPLFKKVISTPHEYTNEYDAMWTIEHPGATAIAIHFSKFVTEAGYDQVTLFDKTGATHEEFDGNLEAFWTFPIPGDKVVIHFKTDKSVTDYGFDIDSYATAP